MAAAGRLCEAAEIGAAKLVVHAAAFCVGRSVLPAVTLVCGLLAALAARQRQGYKTACQRCRSVAQPGRAPRSGRGGRRFKSCHSDQHLAKIKMLAGTDCGTVSHVLLASCAHRSPTDGGTSAVRRRGPSRAGGAPVALRRSPCGCTRGGVPRRVCPALTCKLRI